MNFNNTFHEICPFSIGQRVTVDPGNRFAAEWPGEYAIVGIDWNYNQGDGHGINISIASEDDIKHRHGATDGWSPRDLLPVRT